MKKPPAAVKLVMEAVCIMMGVKPDKIKDPNGGTKKIDDYWGPAQKNLLGDSRFLQNLMDYDKDNMDSAMVEKVQQCWFYNRLRMRLYTVSSCPHNRFKIRTVEWIQLVDMCMLAVTIIVTRTIRTDT